MIKQGDTIVNKRTGQQMTFLKTCAETNGTQLQIDCVSPATETREPEHIHPYQENRFRMLTGELIFKINGKEQKVKAGETVSISKNTPHCFWNAGPDEARYIQEFYPALKIDALFETFFSLAAAGKLNKHGAPNLFRTSIIMLKYQNEIRVVKPSWAVQKILFSLLAPLGKLLGYKNN